MAWSAEPRPSPSRLTPAKGLAAYIEYDGLDAHSKAWKASAAHGILVESHAGPMMTELARQVLDRLCQTVPGCKLTGSDVMNLQEHVVQRGFSIAIHHLDEGESITVVVRDAGAGSARGRFDHLFHLAAAAEEGGKLPDPVKLRGRAVFQLRRSAGPAPVFDVIGAAPPPALDQPARPGSPWLSWWFEGEDLVLVSGPAEDLAASLDPGKTAQFAAAHLKQRAAVLDVIEGKAPSVATSAAYAPAWAEGKDIKGFEPNGLLFIDTGVGQGLLAGLPSLGEDQALAAWLKAQEFSSPPSTTAATRADSVSESLPELPDDPFQPDEHVEFGAEGIDPAGEAARRHLDPAVLLGLDGIKRVTVRWGFKENALLTVVRVEAPAPRKGLVAWVDQPSFRTDRLPPLPRGASTFAVQSFDVAASYQKLVDMLKAIEPELPRLIARMESDVWDATGLRVQEDLLRHLGPTWTVFTLPSLNPNRGEGAEVDPTDFALLAGVDDAEAFLKVLDSIATRLNQYLLDLEKEGAGNPQGKKEAGPPILAMKRLPAPDRGYQLTSPAQLVPWLDDDVKPTILVGKSIVAVASNLDRAREALAAEARAGSRWAPGGEIVRALECLPEKVTFLAVGDHRESPWPDLIEHLPGHIQYMAAMLGDSGDANATAGGELLAVLGIPRPGGFRVRFDPARIPKAEQLRGYLFPSVLAASVDDGGLRLISREAFPLACLGNCASLKSSATWSARKGFDSDIKLNLGLGR
jgi:hypothetical protein